LIIDIHAHLWKDAYRENKDNIMKTVSRYGLAKVYVSGLNSMYPESDEIKELNDEVYQFMREQPGVICGFCYLNPMLSGSIDELKMRIEVQGMTGVKLWVATFCDDPLVFPIVEQCIDYGIPVLVHSFQKAVGQLKHETTGVHTTNLAKRYPEVSIIMAHLGGNCYHGVKAIRDCPNVYVDTSGNLYRRDDIDYTVAQIGAGRILFGTDMPGARYLVNHGRIEEADLTQEQREQIYFGNSIKLMGI